MMTVKRVIVKLNCKLYWNHNNYIWKKMNCSFFWKQLQFFIRGISHISVPEKVLHYIPVNHTFWPVDSYSCPLKNVIHVSFFYEKMLLLSCHLLCFYNQHQYLKFHSDWFWALQYLSYGASLWVWYIWLPKEHQGLSQHLHVNCCHSHVYTSFFHSSSFCSFYAFLSSWTSLP